VPITLLTISLKEGVMDNNTIEIRDDEINVEEIMEKIRENIRRKQAAGELPPDPNTLIPSSSCINTNAEFSESHQRDLATISSTWDIHNNTYFISSHHKYLGKFLVKGRQLVHGEVRRCVDPIVFRQTEFNASAVRLHIHASQQYVELENAFTRLKQETDQKIKNSIDIAKTELDSKNETRVQELDSKNETRVQELDSKNEMRFREWFSQLDADIHTRASLAHVLEERIEKGLVQKGTVSESITHTDTNYFLFEERFRGSREVIKQRQLSFLHYFENCSRVLDIGCGRGEFLEILRDHKIGGIGIDLDADMVIYCQSRQLTVEQSDAITYLEKLEDKSLDGIFIDQVVEHLEPEYLVRLLALCHKKLKFGYYIIVETVNPLSFVSFVNFYIDMTHKRPIHPETLQFLLSAAGFRESEKKFFSPVSDEGRLKKITESRNLDDPARKNDIVYNYNIERLNTILFGAQDYAIIGKK
jgi:O-antigen chain-terminating methyltransferase